MTTAFARRAELDAKLAHLRSLQRPRLKTADLGGDPEAGFEQSFASLAYAYIQDKAPRLLDYLLGFQLVDRNEDNTKAMGVFGFQLGKEMLYAPVFFLNGDLKGHEMLYIKEQDMFVPMKENWINYLLSRKPHVLGEGTPMTMQQLGVRQPDLRRLAIPPQTGKFAAYLGPEMAEWARLLLPDLAYLASTSPKKEPKFAGLDDRLNLPNVLASDLRLVQILKQASDRIPMLKRALDRFYGPDLLRDALLELRKKAVAADSVLTDHPAPPQPFFGSVLGNGKRAAGPPVRITVDPDASITDSGEAMTDEKREQLLRDGYLIEDDRTGEEVSRAYDVQMAVELSNPDQTGLYEVLNKEASFEEMLVVHNPHTGRRRAGDFVTVIAKSGEKGWLNCHRTLLWARGGDTTREEFRKWLDGLSSSRDLEKNGVYVAIGQDGQGSVPFRINESLGEGAYTVDFIDHCPFEYRVESGVPSGPSYGYMPWDSASGPPIVRFNDREGTSFRSVNNTLYVPAEAKVIRVKAPPKPEKDDLGYPAPVTYNGGASDPPPVMPGNLVDLQANILQKTARLKLWTDASEVIINDRRMPKLAGLFCLVRNHGFTEKSAKELLKRAERINGVTCRVKYAYPYPDNYGMEPFQQYATMEGPGAPMYVPEPAMGQEPNSFGTPSMVPQVDFLQVPELSARNTDPRAYSNDVPAPDPMSMQVAQQAAQTGQKEVFDTTMVSGLLKNVREESLVDGYLSDLMKAMDRIFRMLFLFYWHGEDFADRYGKADMPEMEDSLRNAGEVVGDLVLFLKTKTAGPDRDRLGPPNIEENSRS